MIYSTIGVAVDKYCFKLVHLCLSGNKSICCTHLSICGCVDVHEHGSPLAFISVLILGTKNVFGSKYLALPFQI